MSWIDRLRDKLYGFKSESPIPRPVVAEPSRIEETAESPKQETSSDSKEKTYPEKFPERVMFVCSGNICRSAYGEYRFKKMCAECGKEETQVVSAGTLRIQGRAASDEMIETGKERGLDLTPHRSNGISRFLVDSSDVIFVMAPMHRTEILRISPESENKIVLLGEWLNTPKEEIDDPIRQSMDFYRRVTEEIDEALKNWMERHFPSSTP